MAVCSVASTPQLEQAFVGNSQSSADLAAKIHHTYRVLLDLTLKQASEGVVRDLNCLTIRFGYDCCRTWHEIEDRHFTKAVATY